MCMDKKVIDLILKKQLSDDLTLELEKSLAERIGRYLDVKPHEITPHTHFAVPSAECTLLFRDGHFYGCIALCQAVTEALVKFMCKKNGWKPSNNYEENIETLFKRKFLSADLKLDLMEIWKRRDDYHHLNPSIVTDRSLLEELARVKAKTLSKIEGDVFDCSYLEGKLIPKYLQYWETEPGGAYVSVFLKIRP